MSETLVPLNDSRKPKFDSSNSLGSDKDVLLHTAGEEDTLDYRIHASHNTEGKKVSLWHDISLKHLVEKGVETDYYNFICEIPKFTRYG
jgi:hypothetical protein